MPGLRLAFILLAAAAALLGGCGGPGGHLTLRSVATGATYTPPLPTAVYRYQDLNTVDVYLSDVPVESLANPDIDLREWAADEGQNGGAERGATIVHIHLFVLPRAGKTPIDATACNATLRQLVLAPPPPPQSASSRTPAGPAAGVVPSENRRLAVLGLYGGGGFVQPGRGWFGGGGSPGEDTFSGRIHGGRGYGDPSDDEGLSGTGGFGGGVGGGGGGTLRLIRAEPGFADPIGAAELSGSFTAVLDEPLADVMAARLEMLIASIPQVPEPAPQVDAPRPSTTAP